MGAETKLRDLGLCAALASLGFEVLEIERDAGGQGYFIFIKTAELEQAISAYWSNTLEVKARTYSDALKMLKSRLYSER
ncbi:MAG: hypothetical protein JWN38_185 [Candidatus Saccharibacteria bacterium]|nr:hypothetical protein [Candidatus Saccharibacteria bacterium]